MDTRSDLPAPLPHQAPGLSVSKPGPGAPLRILTYNVRRCYGLDGRYAPERIAEVIAESEPDVVALQELDVNRLRSGGIDQAVAIASALRMNVHFHPAMRVVEELYGDAVLSALPLRLVKADALPGVVIRRPHREPRGALWAEVEVDGTPVQIINTHFGLLPGERMKQAEALLGPLWLGHEACREPLILVGDFNSVPSSRSYRRLAARLMDVQARAGIRPHPTFPSRWPLLRIDHVFVSQAIEIEDVRTVRSAVSRVASDHVPLCVDLRIYAPQDNRAAGARNVRAPGAPDFEPRDDP